jgi:pimeloyl-ACP methyl ester carboxylesterase
MQDLEEVVPDLKVRQFLLTNLTLDLSGPNRFKWKINLNGVGKSVQHMIGHKIEKGKFSGPTLFIYGTKGDFVQDSDKPAIRDFFPNVIFKAVDTGHWIHAENPALFIDNVVEFLLDN